MKNYAKRVLKREHFAYFIKIPQGILRRARLVQRAFSILKPRASFLIKTYCNKYLINLIVKFFSCRGIL